MRREFGSRNMSDVKKPVSTDVVLVEILGSAVAEHDREGEVKVARCDVCHSLIKVRALGDSAWTTNCTCGRCRDTLRGI
jgi:hypothetical protein